MPKFNINNSCYEDMYAQLTINSLNMQVNFKKVN